MHKTPTNNDQQVKSQKRIAYHREVFTGRREANAMPNLVKHETQRTDSRFLEPACGNRNFLAEVLDGKIRVVDQPCSKSQIEREQYAVIAISSIYGLDILENNNAQECRERLFTIFNKRYTTLFQTQVQTRVPKKRQVPAQKNILWGDALDFTHPQTKQAIVFSEWSALNGSMFKHRDFMYMCKFLLEKSFQPSLFNDEGRSVTIDKPVKDYPLVHYQQLSDDE